MKIDEKPKKSENYVGISKLIVPVQINPNNNTVLVEFVYIEHTHTMGESYSILDMFFGLACE
jgi:hypothetical protein